MVPAFALVHAHIFWSLLKGLARYGGEARTFCQTVLAESCHRAVAKSLIGSHFLGSKRCVHRLGRSPGRRLGLTPPPMIIQYNYSAQDTVNGKRRCCRD